MVIKVKGFGWPSAQYKGVQIRHSNNECLTIEDNGGVGHIRVCNATTLTVFAHKRPLARILDPLGVGIPGWSYPCYSVIAFGHPTVLAS